MVKTLLMLKVLFTQDFEVEDLFLGASSSCEPSLLYSNYLFGFGFKMILSMTLLEEVWSMCLI